MPCLFTSLEMEIATMKRNQVAATLTIAATLLAGSTAFAAGPTNAEYFPFPETAPATTVRTSNGKVVTNASTTADAKTMGAQGTATPVDRSAEILMYLKAGS
jgi:ABC-type uncharacterized transport system auxiliary subunit